MKLNFKEIISQKSDKELEKILKDHVFYSEDERLLAEEELALRNNPTEELLSKRKGIIKIKTSKDKVIFFTLILLIFIVAGPWMIMSAEQGSFWFRNTHTAQIVLTMCVLYFIALLIVVVRKILSSGFNLTVTKEGLIDNSRYFKVGMIKWEDVDSIESSKVMFNKYLLVNVKSVEKYSSSLAKHMLLEYNLKIYGAPFVISPKFLASDFCELEEIVMKAYEEYKKPPADADLQSVPPQRKK